MPFKSDKQKRWMYANKPEMAKEWSAKEDNEERDRRHHPDYGEPEYDEERSERYREGPPVHSASGETASPTLRDLAKKLDKQIKRKQEKSEREKAFDRRIGQIQQDFKK